jgi:hypothetical protein
MMDITADYNRGDFLGFLADSFLPDDFERSDDTVVRDKSNSCIRNAVKLGLCPSLDLSVYEFLHAGHDPRVKLSREAFSLLGRYENTASNALAVFFNKDTAAWRLSLITSEYSPGKKKGEVKRGFSNPRRYSYMLGKDCKRHTPEQMLFAKGKVNSFKDLASRFAIDTVTKKFFRELFDWYDKWAINVVKFPVGEGGAAKLPAKPDVEANRQHLIRLITRLIFVWFLKQKDKLIPEWIFRESDIAEVLKTFDAHSAKKGNYYNGIVQNLFFATLNKEIENRSFTNINGTEQYGIKTFYRDHADSRHLSDSALFKISPKEFVKKFETVPFLNGGLFECLDRREGAEKQKYVDGFSREKDRAAFVPNCLFFGDEEREGIISLFSRYNFTVEENTPQDIDMALDPELLGKVFENLLGTYNEETKNTARNESGSFYTPREIVDYMVDVSLKEYFKGKLSANGAEKRELEKKLDKLFSYVEAGHDFSPEETKTLMNAIHACKILDPACGSGAYPMGALNKLTFIMEKLDPNNELWEEIQIQKAKDQTGEAYRDGSKEQREKRIREISDVFELSTGKYSNYARKLFLIENCIFGVDIQPIAIQIAKLRFFISLVVDQKTGGGKENNYNILPLPNLETKFVVANSLIGVKHMEAKFPEQGVFSDPEIEKKQQELLVIRHKHFSVRGADEKNRLRRQDIELSKELAELLKKDGFYNSDDAKKIADWNPYDQTKAADFFDASWMFGVELKDGFDVVIGNPPYIQLQNNHGKLADTYKNLGYETFNRTGDIYQLYYESGCIKLKENGHLCFITSNKWMRAAYGEKTRNFLVHNVNPKVLIDFAGQRVFESATVDVNIILAEKNKNQHETLSCIIKEDCKNNMTNYIKQHGLVSEFPASERSWTILSNIERKIKEKIEKVGKPLKDWDIHIYRGILTGCNEAFIIDKVKHDELIKEDPTSANIIRPILRGRDIKRYGYEFAEQYIIVTFPSRKYNIDDYPAVRDYLLKYGKKKLEQSGKPGARKKTSHKWFETQDSIAYWEDFSKQKIMYREISDEMNACYIGDEMFTNNKAYLITGEKLEYLLGILNSRLFNNIIFQNANITGGKGAGFLNQIKIPYPDNNEKITALVLKRLHTPLQGEIKMAENKIDAEIYNIYNLDKNEIDYLNSAGLP